MKFLGSYKLCNRSKEYSCFIYINLFYKTDSEVLNSIKRSSNNGGVLEEVTRKVEE